MERGHWPYVVALKGNIFGNNWQTTEIIANMLCNMQKEVAQLVVATLGLQIVRNTVCFKRREAHLHHCDEKKIFYVIIMRNFLIILS